MGSLGSFLLERGEDAPRLWAEEIRHQGRAQLDARLDIGDLVREFHSLHRAVLEEWEKRAGPMSHEVAKLLSESIDEGTASAVSDYVRRVRGEQVQFRESALIHMLLENLDEGLLLVEADGTLSFATRPAFQVLGGRVHSVLGRSLFDPAMVKLLGELRAQTLEGEPVSPADLPGAKTLQTSQPAGPMLMEIHVDGKAKVLELGSLPIFEEDRGATAAGRSRLRGAIITARDRTLEARKTQELKQAEREPPSCTPACCTAPAPRRWASWRRGWRTRSTTSSTPCTCGCGCSGRTQDQSRSRSSNGRSRTPPSSSPGSSSSPRSARQGRWRR
ncbi:MAG: hypothetical protein QM765_01750 [Myxococcales bacterium]